MTPRRHRLAESLALTAIAAVTGWLATTAWAGFTEAPGRYLQPLALLALLVAALGAGLRALRLPAALVLLSQLIVGAIAAGSLAAGTLVITAEGWLQLGSRLTGAVETAQSYQAPVPADVPGIEPLLVLGGWVCLVLIDLCVGGLRRVSLAGLPLLTIYSVPVSMLSGGVPWWSFALTAGGFLALLFVQHREQTSRWGRGLGQTNSQTAASGSTASSVVRASAASLGAIALLLAVMIPQFVPTLSLDVLGFGPGSGSGGDINVQNPMTDLRRDLLRGDDVPLLRVETDNPDPGYLRIAALTRFSDNEWSTGDRAIPDSQRAQGRVPLDGVAPSIPRKRYPTTISVMQAFESTWLPTQYPIEDVFAVGDWRYDTTTMDFLAADDDLDTAGITYQTTEVVLNLDGLELAEAPSWAGDVDRDYIELPDGFPASVRTLAQEVTREEPSSYEKAVALQQWFREDGGFEYSLDNVETGNGTDELVAFLTEGDGGRVGYCEQFSAAMAVMARSLGIPARVAVGFLTPDRVGPRSYEYSSYDLHAWPELYFADAGWVRFEPTPPARATNVPGYTLDRIPSEEQPETPEQTQDPLDARGDQPQGRQPDPGNLPEGETGAGGDDSSALVPVLRWTGGGLLVVAIGLLPRWVRRRRARIRLHGGAEAAWAEIRATALDLGVGWPEHRSPQETARALCPHLGPPRLDDARRSSARGPEVAPEADEALSQVVARLEQLRYARPSAGLPGERPGELAPQVRLVTAALTGGATDRARRRARWWPVSVLPWGRGRRDLLPSLPLVRHGGVVDHVG